MIPADVKKELARYKRIKKKLSKIRVGLPKEVVFVYNAGKVTCYPKQRKWIVVPNGKKPVLHLIHKDSRIDVTKYKARRYLKLAIAGYLRDDSKLLNQKEEK